MVQSTYSSLHPLPKILKLLKLNLYYDKGKGDYLFYKNEQGNSIKVLDVSGSYGLNLLGYNNSAIEACRSYLQNEIPNFIQLSEHPERNTLEARLQKKLHETTQYSQWIFEFASTGSEIIETALKILQLDYSKRITTILQEINATLHTVANHTKYHAAYQQILKEAQALQTAGNLAYIEDAYHGKTLGALSILGNQNIKNQFLSQHNYYCIPKSSFDIKQFLENTLLHYTIYDERKDILVQKSFLPIIGLFFEPIQGEAGVHILSEELLNQIFQLQKEFSIPIVADEIQCGLYRTGALSAIKPKQLIADIYCFGKQLGAGIAKIAMLCCKEHLYDKKLYEVSTATFSSDSFSSFAANAFLSVVDKESALIAAISENKWLQQLQNLHKTYPDYIDAIRGVGLMLSISLKESCVYTSYLSKFLKDIDKLGYWIASVLLHQEQLRIFPSLSAPLSFRIQPSIYFGVKEIAHLIAAWAHFFEALKKNDIAYLFGHLFPIPNHLKQLKPFPENLQSANIPKGSAVFICHPIHSSHAADIVDLISYLGADTIEMLLDELSYLQEFTIYHTDELYDKYGNKTPIIYLGIPMTSYGLFQAIRRGRRTDWVEKIQKAINWANQQQASVIGLGQYTSIISKNGTLLHSPNALLTSGNAYTAALTIDAIQYHLQLENKTMREASLCVIGAKGNILSVITKLLAPSVKHIILVFRNQLQVNNDTYRAVVQLLQHILQSEDNGYMSQFIKAKALSQQSQATVDWMQLITDCSAVLTIENTISFDTVGHADIVIIGTNDTKIILEEAHISPDALVVDIAVPSNACVALQQSKNYIKGGIAALPLVNDKKQHLESVILPFGAGECYACMAETFGIAMDKNWQQNNIGDIDTQTVTAIQASLTQSGFHLKRVKREDSL